MHCIHCIHWCSIIHSSIHFMYNLSKTLIKRAFYLMYIMVSKGYNKKVLNKDGSVRQTNGKKPITGRYSKVVDNFKKKHGLVTHDEIKQLPADSFELLQKKIKLMNEFAIANQRMVDLIGGVGGRVVNSLNMFVDLQARMLMYENTFTKRKELAKERLQDIEVELESCDDEKRMVRLSKERYDVKKFILSDIIEDKSWQDLRKQMATEVQFIHKHGIDAADVQSKISARKAARDDDDLFTVEVDVNEVKE